MYVPHLIYFLYPANTLSLRTSIEKRHRPAPSPQRSTMSEECYGVSEQARNRSDTLTHGLLGLTLQTLLLFKLSTGWATTHMPTSRAKVSPMVLLMTHIGVPLNESVQYHKASPCGPRRLAGPSMELPLEMRSLPFPTFKPSGGKSLVPAARPSTSSGIFWYVPCLHFICLQTRFYCATVHLLTHHRDDFADNPSFAVVDQNYNPLINMQCA